MKAGDNIYIIQHGSIGADDMVVESVHSTHRGAVSFVVQAAKAMVEDMSEDPTAEWTDVSDLDTYSLVRRKPKNKDTWQDMCWWDIKVVKLKY